MANLGELYFESKDPPRVTKARLSNSNNVSAVRTSKMKSNEEGYIADARVASIISPLTASDNSATKKGNSFTDENDLCVPHLISPIEHILHRCQGRYNLDTKSQDDFKENLPNDSTHIYNNDYGSPTFDGNDDLAVGNLNLENYVRHSALSSTPPSPRLGATDRDDTEKYSDNLKTYDKMDTCDSLDTYNDVPDNDFTELPGKKDDTEDDVLSITYSSCSRSIIENTTFHYAESVGSGFENSPESLVTDVSKGSTQCVNDWLEERGSGGPPSCHMVLDDDTKSKDLLFSESTFVESDIDYPFESLNIDTVFEGLLQDDYCSRDHAESECTFKASTRNSKSADDNIVLKERRFKNYEKAKHKTTSIKISQYSSKRCHDSGKQNFRTPNTLLELSTGKDGVTFARQRKITEDIDRLRYLEEQIIGASPRRASRRPYRLTPLKDVTAVVEKKNGRNNVQQKTRSMSSVFSQTSPIIMNDAGVQVHPSVNNANTQTLFLEKLENVENSKPIKHLHENGQRHRTDKRDAIKRANKLSKYSCVDNNILNERALGCEFNTKLENRDYIATRVLPPIPKKKSPLRMCLVHSGKSKMYRSYK